MSETQTVYPWQVPGAPEHVRVRQPVMEIAFPSGVRLDVPRRRVPDVLSQELSCVSFGVTIMSHRGASNGRLSLLLSTIPENYEVRVSSDTIDEQELEADRAVCEAHGATLIHCTPWGGRACNAIHAMDIAPWDVVLFLNDDIYLFPEAVRDALRWFVTLERHSVPLAALAVPGWESYHHWQDWGFSSWEHCMREPLRLEAVPPHPRFSVTPALYKNPFGAAMVLSRKVYKDLGGFTPKYWAEDDVYNHQVWLSETYVNACYPGRGYIHFGAQSWHHGESVEFVGQFDYATGMSADESGALQVKSMQKWAPKLAHVFESFGGTPCV